ncbi:MAG: restriction endonuclease [Candidatus Dormibacteria bacterium]
MPALSYVTDSANLATPLIAVALVALAALAVGNRPGRVPLAATSLEGLQALSWSDCAAAVARAFRRHGYRVEMAGGRAASRGVDMILHRAGEKVLVHCRHWNVWTVSDRTVTRLHAAMADEGASRGIVLTCGGYSDATLPAAAAANIELIDGAGLVELVSTASDNSRAVP